MALVGAFVGRVGDIQRVAVGASREAGVGALAVEGVVGEHEGLRGGHALGLVESHGIGVREVPGVDIGVRNHERPPARTCMDCTCALVDACDGGAGAVEHAEPVVVAGGDYQVATLLNRLEESNPDSEALVQFDWAFFPLLEHSERTPNALYRQLQSNPREFAKLVCSVYRAADSDDEPSDDIPAHVRHVAWSVLQEWRRLPGLDEDNRVDADALRVWVIEARRLLADENRADVGDVCIGELLSSSPMGDDGAWPAEPVRELVEEISSERLESGLRTGIYNSRGVTVRGPYDGGKQERDLAEKYQAWALQIEGRWRRTGRLLHDIADGYELDARREDEQAERWADEG